MNIIGKRIKIIGNHPHSNEFGIVDRVEKTAFGSVGWIIKLEDCPHGTNECFIFKSENLKIVK